ncbi:uncharacterized protein LOC127474606 [Manacus candei]|uniref:uncharacterized protein LOC127474606 n=1 Tax=Manacus candei TaxID=415023 RepID=UPI0022276944|nr:uncharacterized protein LOC127474606 [Manacus candei]
MGECHFWDSSCSRLGRNSRSRYREVSLLCPPPRASRCFLWKEWGSGCHRSAATGTPFPSDTAPVTETKSARKRPDGEIGNRGREPPPPPGLAEPRPSGAPCGEAAAAAPAGPLLPARASAALGAPGGPRRHPAVSLPVNSCGGRGGMAERVPSLPGYTINGAWLNACPPSPAIPSMGHG